MSRDGTDEEDQIAEDHTIASGSSNDHVYASLTRRLDSIAPKARQLAVRLRLRRSIVFVDLESTGTEPLTDRIVEIGVVKLNPSGETEILYERLNPGEPIPTEASAVHGITDEMVAERPTFGEIASSVADFLSGCDLAGFGIARFDIPLLEAEFRREGIEFSIAERRVVDALRIFHDRERRDLAAAVDFYTGQEIEDAHNAIGDAMSSVEVLWGQFERYADLPTELDDLDRVSQPLRPDPSWLDPDGKLVWQGEEVLLNFGKYTGLAVSEVQRTDPGYLEWVLRADFSDEVKEALASAMDRRSLDQAGTTD